MGSCLLSRAKWDYFPLRSPTLLFLLVELPLPFLPFLFRSFPLSLPPLCLLLLPSLSSLPTPPFLPPVPQSMRSGPVPCRTGKDWMGTTPLSVPSGTKRACATTSRDHRPKGPLGSCRSQSTPTPADLFREPSEVRRPTRHPEGSSRDPDRWEDLSGTPEVRKRILPRNRVTLMGPYEPCVTHTLVHPTPDPVRGPPRAPDQAEPSTDRDGTPATSGPSLSGTRGGPHTGPRPRCPSSTSLP